MSAPKQPETLEEMIFLLEDATWKVMEDKATDLEKFITHDCLFIFAGGLRLGRDTEPTLRESLRSEAYIPTVWPQNVRCYNNPRWRGWCYHLVQGRGYQTFTR